MKLTQDLRMLLLGMWLVVTGLLLVVSTVIAIMTKMDRDSVDAEVTVLRFGDQQDDPPPVPFGRTQTKRSDQI